MTPSPEAYIRFHESVEVPQPGEEQSFTELASTMVLISTMINDRCRHAARSVHAKSHGLLRAELKVLEQLPPELAQGLFQPGSVYPAIMRFSTNPGDILPDSISTPRGLAVKLLNVEGKMVAEHEGQTTQDIVMVNGKAFPDKDAAKFLESVKLLETHVNDSEAFKQVVSTTAQAAETVLEAAGTESALLKNFGHLQTNVLGETFSTIVPVRYGDYIAKICLEPESENLKERLHKHVGGGGHSPLRDAVVEFFKTEEAVWAVKVQLCKDLTAMPVEDASVLWPEDVSPFRTVAYLTAGPQDAYSAARRTFVDERLSFNPWHALEAHRPLGNIMRARKRAYALSSAYRHETNGQTATEPRSIQELPA
jgi:catalase